MFQNLDQLIEITAEKFANDTFLETKKRLRIDRYNFATINKLSKKLKTLLESFGLKKGDRILLWGPNSVEWVISFFGAIRGGFIAVPVDVRTSLAIVERYVEQTEPKIIFVSKINNISINSFKVPLFYFEDLLRELDSLETGDGAGVGWDDDAEIVFTSGSTGDPKGVLLTHGNLISSIASLEKSFPVSRDLKLLSVLPLSHIFEQVAGLFLPFVVGAKVVYLPRVNSITIIKGLRRHKITSILVVPQILHLMLLAVERQLENQGKLGLFKKLLAFASFLPFTFRKIVFLRLHQELGGHIKFFACGGAALEENVGKTWEAMGFRIYQGYGSTETAALSTINLLGGDKIGYAGRPVLNVEVKIAADGEVLVKGPSVFKGYFRAKEKTKAAFSNGWYKTGDIGKMDKDDWLYLVGREKFRIVLPDGRKVYPEDIEKKLNNHPRVKDSCVIGLRSKGRRYLHAVILTDFPGELLKIITEVNQNLEAHEQISHFSIWPGNDFPRLRNLKVDRVAVEKIMESESMKQLEDEELENEKRKLDAVSKIVSQIAEVDSSKINDETNLVVDLRLDSLKRIEIISTLEEELGLVLDESKISSNTTIGQLKKMATAEKVVKERRRTTWPRWGVTVRLRTLIQDAVIFPLHALFAPIKCSGGRNLDGVGDSAIFFINHLGPHDMLIPLRLLPRERRKKVLIAADSGGWKRFTEGFFLEFLGNAYAFVKEGEGVRESLEFTGELLDAGYSLLIAPEGRFSPDGTLQPFRKGTGLLGVEFGIDLVPIKIDKAYREIFPDLNGKIGELIPRKRRQINVKIGKPLQFSEDTDYDLATKKMEEAMKKL